MTNIYTDLYAQARFALMERNYGSPRLGRDELAQAIGSTVWESQGYGASASVRIAAVAEQNAPAKALLDRIAVDFMTADTDSLPSLDHANWYLIYDGDSIEEFVATAHVVIDTDPRYDAAGHKMGVGSPTRLKSIADIQEQVQRDNPHYTFEFHDLPGVLSHGYYLRATATLVEDAIPANLRSHLDPGEREHEEAYASVRRATDAYLLGSNGLPARADAVVGVMRYNRNFPTTLESLTTRLLSRREYHRNNIRRNMPGRLAQERVLAAEQQAAYAKRREAVQKYLKYRASKSPVAQMLIPTLPFVEHKVKASLRWGIEIETGAGRDLSGTPESWDNKGDGSLESAYGAAWTDPADCPEYSDYHTEATTTVYLDNGSSWEVPNPDFEDPRYCSYCCDNGSDYDEDDCVELVSPILTSMHSRGLKQICDDLEYAPRTDSAGIHVHVEAKELTVRQISQLVLAYDSIEHLIESSYDRVERGYCKRRSADDILEIARDAKTAPNQQSMNKGDRYVTVNLQALSAHGTIEFRAMGPKYNYDHLVRWAMFCREMVNCAKNGATMQDWAKVKDWEGVLGMFLKFGVEYKMALGIESADFDATADVAAV
jgi:hypothetical protein